jgi:flagellar hook-associated protein 1
MSGITSAIDTALSGLQLFEAGIGVVSNNLANEMTPGYSVETVNANTQAGVPGQPGAGVQAPTISRAASSFAAAVLRSANSANAAASNLSSSLTSISNGLTNSGNVQTSMNQFFQDISTLAANPTSAAQGQTVLGDAQAVVGTFQSAAGAIDGAISGASQTLTQSVASANNLLGQLATINQDLAVASNDPSLLDQQQNALNSLSSLINVNVSSQPNGSVVVTTGGTVLLDQSGAQTLNVVNGNTNNNTAPTLTAGNNDAAVPLTEADGAIGSSVTAWQAGTTAMQGLNTLAAVFASTINTSQAEGLTSSGAQGAPLFSVPAPSVTPTASNSNTATVTAQITNSAAVPTNGGPFLLSYSSTAGWTAQDQSTGTTYTSTGTPPTVAGMTLNVTGTPTNGDQFVLNPAPDAATGIAVAATSPGDIASADPYVATPGTLQSNGSIVNSNGGTITAGADTVTSTPATGANATQLPPGYYGQSLQITFSSPTAYTVATTANPNTPIISGTLSGGTPSTGNIIIPYPTTNSTSPPFPTNSNAAGQYWQLPISGTPVAGDTLTLTPGGTSSGSNASRMATLWNGPTNTTSGTLQQAVIGFSTSLGANAQQAQLLSTATVSQVTSATNNLQTISGVSSDQQAVTLTNYQQAYQAVAQTISVANTMFQSLLTAI